MRIFFASDHAGYALKNALVAFVRDELGFDAEDLGAHEFAPEDDYPEFIAPAARRVAEDPQNIRAIILGGSGQGEAMVANRMRGVRAVVYYGGAPEIIRLSREHNDANILSLGGRFLSEEDAKAAVKLWLETPFSGAKRHVRRIAEIDENTNSEDAFDQWNLLKKKTHKTARPFGIQEGAVYFMCMGKNIGSEQNGKGVAFHRPVLVLRKTSTHTFIGVPLTTQVVSAWYHVIFHLKGKPQAAIVSQVRVWDTRRVTQYIGRVPRVVLRDVREKTSALIGGAHLNR